MTDREFVSVFRSSKKMDTYIYVRRGQVWDDLPEALRSIFGKPVHSMDLLLTPDKKLARTTGKKSLKLSTINPFSFRCRKSRKPISSISSARSSSVKNDCADSLLAAQAPG